MKRKIKMVLAVAITAGVVAGTAACSTSSSSGGTEASGPINFIASNDPGGGYQKLADNWNALHPNQKVTYITYSGMTANQQHDQLVQNFQAKSGKFDVISASVLWTPEFAARKWIAPIADSQAPFSTMLPGPVKSVEYQGKKWAIPMYTDAALLWYRKDLISTAPTTFSEIQKDCQQVKSAGTAPGISCFAGQNAKYDGLVYNYEEAVLAEGSTILTSSGKPNVNTPQAKAALQLMVNGYKQGWIPQDALTYQEDPSRIAFQQGKLVFLRNWPYVYSLLSKAGSDNQVAGKFAATLLPGVTGHGTSTLGGWNLMVNTFGTHQKTAKAFAVWVAQPSQQKILLERNSLAPVVSSLYDDPTLISKFPYLPELKATLQTATPVPTTTNWTAESLAVQNSVYAAIQGQTSVDSAMKSMQSGMQAALSK
jgi:multiple sugar transport system substrate-binding protein